LWQKEKSNSTIITEYQQLLAALQKRRNTVRQNQEEIKGLIIGEIIKRYQYQEEFFINFIKLIQK
jgi:carboxyl-terminal processing protease